MSNTNLYNKYRPIQLSDLVGQEVVVRSLTKQAKTGTFSHAYLFAGKFGSGKTTVARILATLMNCPERKPGSDKACGRCKYCVGIHNGNCIDVNEIDAASSRGIEATQQLRKDAYYAPNQLKYKIYIIDECHMLTTESKNSLLKVLEQPPPYVCFMLCTTEVTKIIDTVVSRCQKWLFAPVQPKDVAKRLTVVAEREGVKLEDGVALSLARHADGSMRDAYRDLEQIFSFSSGSVSSKDLQEFFGVPDKTLVYRVVRSIVEQNVSALLHVVNDMVVAGVSPQVLLGEVTDALRNMMLLKHCGRDENLISVDKNEMDVLEELAGKTSEKALVMMASNFGKLDRQVAININSRWILEAALLNCILIVNSEAQKAVTGRPKVG